jgi:hypothetical protein
MDDEVMHMGSDHEFFVMWDKAFGGHTTRLNIVQRGLGKVSTASLSWDHDPKQIVAECPIEVMRRIVAMFDALPPVQAAAPKRR